MLVYCGWVERHEILLNNDGWTEEHVIQTMDDNHRGYEIKFVVDMNYESILIVSMAMNNPRVDNYNFNMGNLLA